MPNLSVTTLCNRSCNYCFARDTVKLDTSRSPHITSEDFDLALDRIQQSGADQVRLLGGEPTLHPLFPAFVDRVLARNLRLIVFSNGLMPEAAVQRLEQVAPQRGTVLINLAPPGCADHARQRSVLGRLGPRTMLGVTIDSPARRLEPLLGLVAELGLARSVRLGLAHPRLGGDNTYLPARLYAAVGARVAALAAAARDAGVAIELDCGFVPCMFPAETMEALGPARADLGRRCNPLPDLLPDGTTVACYPLASLWRTRSVQPLDELRHEAEERLAPYRTIGIFRECSRCAARRSGACRGGCLALALRRMRGQPVVHRAAVRPVQVAARSTDRPRWVIPYVDQPLQFWRRVAGEYGDHVREVYLPIPGVAISSGRPPQPQEHLQALLRWGGLKIAVLVNPVVLPQPLERLAPRLVDALRRLMQEHGVASVTVANLDLARHIREHLPSIQITASTLMEISEPDAAAALNGICDHLVPASAIMRDLPRLRALRAAFAGRIRLLVNEACLSGCELRNEHFGQMAGSQPHPASSCEPLLGCEPWRRLTGSFVLPQHLHLYDGVYDDLKLAGRVTLRNAEDYLRVLGAYLDRRPLQAHAIGGGPASVLEPLELTETFFRRTLFCGHRCSDCTFCRDHYEYATARAS